MPLHWEWQPSTRGRAESLGLPKPMSNEPEESRGVRTIKLSAKDIAAAARVLTALIAKPGADELPSLQMLAGQGDSAPADEAKSTPVDRETLRRRAAETLRVRKERHRHFSASLFGEPAWEMLLLLYVNDGVRFTIKRLSDHAGLAPTTALRWIDYLAQKEFILRDSHPTDLRKVLVELAEPGRRALDMYFSETLKPTA
jgi:DNA-binding MarR family transcriptional regulator